MLFRHNSSIAQQLMPIYYITVHENENNTNVALNVAITVGAIYKTPTYHKGVIEEDTSLRNFLTLIVTWIY